MTVCSKAANGGQLELLKKFHWEIDYRKRSTLVYQAALGKQLHMLEWMKEKYYFGDDAFCAAAESGSTEVLDWFFNNIKNVPTLILEGGGIREAARSGKREAIEWLLNKGATMSDGVAYEAAKAGDLGLLKWAIEKGCDFFETCLISEAAEAGQIEILQWCINEGYTIDASSICERVARSGSISALAWAIDYGGIMDDHVCLTAMRMNHVALLKWIIDSGYSWNENLACEGCKIAVAKGYVELLKYLLENGGSIDTTQICNEAASAGQVKILEWAREMNFPWGKQTSMIAATKQSLSVMQFLEKTSAHGTSKHRLK